MNARRIALTLTSAVACLTFLVGCNGTGGTDNDNTASASATSTTEDANKALLDEIAPCGLLSDADMNTLFKTTGFGHEGGGFVEDFHGRHCQFTGSNARIDNDASRYSREDVSIDVLTQLDDKNGTLWQSMKGDSSKATVAITGVDEALKVGNGWIQAKRRDVIITVQDNNQVLNDTSAASVIALAFKNLSGHHG